MSYCQFNGIIFFKMIVIVECYCNIIISDGQRACNNLDFTVTYCFNLFTVYLIAVFICYSYCHYCTGFRSITLIDSSRQCYLNYTCCRTTFNSTDQHLIINILFQITFKNICIALCNLIFIPCDSAVCFISFAFKEIPVYIVFVTYTEVYCTTIFYSIVFYK